MKKMMMTAAAISILSAGSALAADKPAMKPEPATQATQNAAPGMVNGTFYVQSQKAGYYASELIGSRVYVITNDVTDVVTPAERKEWKDIGEINNLVIAKDGRVQAVVLGVGGFLGIGEKDVAVNMNALRFVKEANSSKNNYFIVVKSTKQALDAAPAFKKID